MKIGNKKQYFWDYNFADKTKTTARLVMHKPVKKDAVIVHDEPWEGPEAIYHNIIKDGDIYRMYYLTRCEEVNGLIVPGRVCYAESRDGMHWHKPALGLRAYKNMLDTNIILDDTDDLLDNFFVFLDTAPGVSDKERYKGIAVSYMGAKTAEDVALWCWTSTDGIHFKKDFIMTDEGTFDSLNTVVYDSGAGEYYCYFRGHHKNENGEDFRDVRVMKSKDFRNWTDPQRITFQTENDFQLYTNGVFRLVENPDVSVGLATRYVERKEWTPNYDELCGREKRRYQMELWEPRAGLAITDCLFMTSVDGYHWHRFDEAWLTPGIEEKDNWVYGDCYPCIGLVEDETYGYGEPKEWSIFMKEGHRSMKPAVLYRHVIRKDGFVSLHSDYEESRVFTKDFEYQSGTMYLNFSTSAAGHIFVNVLDENDKPIDGYTSCELFGDSVCRKVVFDKDMELLKGKKIKLEFLMSDAELYSVVFK